MGLFLLSVIVIDYQNDNCYHLHKWMMENIDMGMDKVSGSLGQQVNINHQPIDVPKIISSEILFSGQRELTIQHMGQIYRLRQTQQGKLILTK